MTILFDFLNRAALTALEIDPDSSNQLKGLEGKVLCIELTAPTQTIYVIPEKQDEGISLRIMESWDGECDVVLTGNALAFARLATGGLDSGVMGEGQVTLKGDAEVGQQFQRFLNSIDLDWEELIARYIGDTPARKAGNIIRELGDWASESADLSKSNFAEYLQEEKRILPTNLAMERFEENVNDLRADVERLEQRVSRMINSLRK